MRSMMKKSMSMMPGKAKGAPVRRGAVAPTPGTPVKRGPVAPKMPMSHPMKKGGKVKGC